MGAMGDDPRDRGEPRAGALRFLPALGLITSAAIACGGRGALEAYDFDASDGSGGAGGAPTTTSATTSSNVTVSVSSVTSVGPSTVVTTTTGPGPLCDGTGDCSSCFDCSVQSDCALPWATCLQSPGCNAMIDCVNGCFDDPFVCFQGCSVANPGGAQLLENAIVCTFCGECMSDCAGALDGFCD